MSRLNRVLAAVALAALVSLTPASAATHAKGERRARVKSQSKESTSWVVQVLTTALEAAGVRIDPSGLS